MPRDAAAVNRENVWGALLIMDGGMRLLGAYMVWLALCVCAADDLSIDMDDPGCVELVTSLLHIPTYLAPPEGSALQSAVGMIARQNVAAKQATVSSFQWAGVLRQLTGGTSASLAEAVALYNAHPDVVARRTLWLPRASGVADRIRQQQQAGRNSSSSSNNSSPSRREEWQ